MKETINLNPEYRELLGRLCDHIDWLRAFCELTGIRTAADTAQTQEREPAPQWGPAPETIAVPEPEKDTDLTPVKVTVDDIRGLVGQLIGQGKKAEARDTIKTYAPNIPGIPDDKLAEVQDKLTRLLD